MTNNYPSPQHNKSLSLGISTKHHILSSCIISEFSSCGYLYVFSETAQKVERKSRSWRGSWLPRQWSHGAEKVAASYEKGLHNKIARCKSECVFRSHSAASEYYACWRAKDYLSRNVLEDKELFGCSAGDLNDIELDVLESKNITGIVSRGGRTIVRGVDYTGSKMLMDIMAFLSENPDVKWQLVISQAGEFVAPMTPPKLSIIPICPDMVLMAVQQGKRHSPLVIRDQGIIDEINLDMVVGEDRLFVGRKRATVERVAKLKKQGHP